MRFYDQDALIVLLLYSVPVEHTHMLFANQKSDLLDFTTCNNKNGMLYILKSFDMQTKKVLGKNVGFQPSIKNIKPLNLASNFFTQ